MPTRHTEDIDVKNVIECINLDKGMVDGLLDLNRDELAAVLGHIANEGNIPNATFKIARSTLPSFSIVKWTDFASDFGLPTNPAKVNLTCYSTPRFRLPPSFQKTMFQNSWNWQDVYRETADQPQEQARLRILDPVCRLKGGSMRLLMMCAAVYCSDYSFVSGSSHRHAWGGNDGDPIFYWRPSWAWSSSIVWFLFCAGPEASTLVDLHDRRYPSPRHRVQAQSAGCQRFGSTFPCASVCVRPGFFLSRLCCAELYPAAAEENKNIKFDKLRVYGLLTNAVMFYFYSYDPISKKFCFDERIMIANKRLGILAEMVDGAYFFIHSHLELTSPLCSFQQGFWSHSVGLYGWSIRDHREEQR